MKKIIFGKPKFNHDLWVYPSHIALKGSVFPSEGIRERKNSTTLQQLMKSAALKAGRTPLSAMEQIALFKDSIDDRKSLHTEGFFVMLQEFLQTIQRQEFVFTSYDDVSKEVEMILSKYKEKRDALGYSDYEVMAHHAMKETKNCGSIAFVGFSDFVETELAYLDFLSTHNDITIYFEPIEPTPHKKELVQKFLALGFTIEGEKVDVQMKKAPAWIAMGNRGMIHAILDQLEGFSNHDVEIIFANDGLKDYFEIQMEEKNIGLFHGRRIPLFETKIGQEILAWIEGEFTSSFWNEHEDTKDFELWMEEQRNAFKQDPQRQILSFLYEKSKALGESDSYFSATEWLALEKMSDMFQKEIHIPWKKLFATQEGKRWFSEYLKEMSIRTPENSHGLRTYVLSTAPLQEIGHRIFVGFSKDFPQTQEKNPLLDRLHSQEKREENRVRKLSVEADRLDTLYSLAGSVSFIFDGTDEKLDGESLMSISPLVEKYRPNLAWVFTEDSVPVNDVKIQALPTISSEIRPLPSSYHASSLNSYRQCPFQYWVRYVLRPIEEKSDGYYLQRGNFVHQVLEYYYRVAKDEINQALLEGNHPSFQKEIFSDAIQEAHTQNPDILDFQIDAWRKMLAAYIEADLERLTREKRFIIHQTEFSFEGTLPTYPHIWVHGIIDRIDGNGNDAWIGDYKTGAQKNKQDFIQLRDFQLILYSLMYHQAAVYYGYVQKGELQNVYSSFPTSSTPMFQKQEWEGILHLAEEEIDAMDKKIQSRAFPITPGDACDYCSYDGICRKGDDHDTQ